jgi:phytanoyl-CoA hydroxylase
MSARPRAKGHSAAVDWTRSSACASLLIMPLETPGRLSDANFAEYWESGYMKVPRLFSPQVVAGFEDRFLEIVSGSTPTPRNMTVMMDVMVAKGAIKAASRVFGVNKILSFENDPSLFAYALDPALLGVVRALLGHELQTISTNVFNKPPEIDGRHPLHQDLRYFALRPVDAIVGTWTAISPASRENGCIAVIPRSHRGGLLAHARPDWTFVNSGFQGAEGVDVGRRVHIEMDPGDTLFMHPLLIHGSGRNRTTQCRRAISVHYGSRSCQRPPGTPKRVPVVRAIPDGPSPR